MSAPASASTPAAPAQKRPRRWVQDEIARLDPNTQYNEILKLVADYTLDYLPMNLTLLVATAGATLAPEGARTLVGTGKMLTRTEQRFNDGNVYFLTWFFNGSRSEKTRASVEKLNRYHMSVATTFPDAFGRHEDYIYTLGALAVFGPRMREALGLRPQPEAVDIAWYNFLRDLSEYIQTSTGPLQGFPKDHHELRALVEEWEARDWPSTPEGHQLITGMMQQLLDRFFPPRMHWFGRTLIQLITPPNIRRVQGMGDPGRITGPLVKFLFGTAFRLKEDFAPDPTVPFSQIYGSPQDQENTKRRNEKVRQLQAARGVANSGIKPPVSSPS